MIRKVKILKKPQFDLNKLMELYKAKDDQRVEEVREEAAQNKI